MTKLAQNIRSQLAKLRMTQRELAEQAGISQVMVHKLLSGKSNSTSKILELARTLECTPDWLVNGEGSVDSLAIANVKQELQSKIVPLISWVQAGIFCDNDIPIPIDETTTYYPCPVASAGPNTYALKVIGDSMTSTSGSRSYPEGTIIFVDPDLAPLTSKRVIARLNSGITFKQLMENENGTLYLKPLNDRHELIYPEDGMHVCGVVIGAFMPE